MKVIPIMVRILPMDKHNEFKEQEIEEVQERFFLKDLPYRKDKYGTGKFLYKKSAMNAEPGTIVLFQYDNKIIALAELTLIQKFNKPQIGDDYDKSLPREEYNGAYYFEPTSIVVFDPINSKQIQGIWGEGFMNYDGRKHKGFEGFNRVKQFLNPIRFRDFRKLLNNVRRP
jgi:hypothetical protein